ncbi:HIT domain-containing protein [Solemya velesiana gill symbiont]|uniref:HIT domain-containing protein n=1 Tax=Solemya velesiana gill symbiont TaxID=1918948 RepID=A0A1T2KTM5_9GAMM|nr:HIT family protein [Solemya velesiana gill symbiont]OOZ36090.1 hypothetical protein BOW51_08840 [Solemya velesiana gill symbiont]
MQKENATTTLFELHPRLAADTLAVANLELCEVRLLNDSRFPWLILVPRRNDVTEVHQLDRKDQQQLMAESSLASRLLLEITRADKINIGALGNLVPQLHWHVVARRHDDACWPGPVWGCGQASPYPYDSPNELLSQVTDRLKAAV